MFKIKKVLFCLAIIPAIGAGSAHFSYTLKVPAAPVKQDSQIILAPAAPVRPIEVPSVNIRRLGLAEDINQFITANAGSNLEVAVSVVDLDNNQQYDAGQTGTIFKAASTAKLLTVLAYMHEVEQGRGSLDQYIGGTSARQLIEQMLKISDNDASTALRDYLGSSKQAYAESIGLGSFTGEDYNTITAADQAKLLTLLHQGKLVNDSHRELVYEHMKSADGEDLIKAALPPESTVYHKYGRLWGNLHDIAIVNRAGRNFALVIYTNDLGNTLVDNDSRVRLIHGLTQLINQKIL